MASSRGRGRVLAENCARVGELCKLWRRQVRVPQPLLQPELEVRERSRIRAMRRRYDGANAAQRAHQQKGFVCGTM